jgi:hypothetical protein
MDERHLGGFAAVKPWIWGAVKHTRRTSCRRYGLIVIIIMVNTVTADEQQISLLTEKHDLIRTLPRESSRRILL